MRGLCCRAKMRAEHRLLEQRLRRGRLQGHLPAHDCVGRRRKWSVTSTPAAIDCGAKCTGDFPTGSGVQLTAAPSLNSTFAGWTGGGCTGTSSCLVTMNSAQSVTATFAPGPRGGQLVEGRDRELPDTGYTVALDPQGNIFVAGLFQGAYDFGAGLVTSVGNDIFVAKYSSSGAYQWARHFTGSNVLPLGIATDANGDVYIAGRFVGHDCNLGDGALSCSLNIGYNNGFVAKYIGRGRTRARSPGSIAWREWRDDLRERTHGGIR